MSLWNLFLLSFLSENIVLTRFLGICPFMGTTRSFKSAFSMGLAVTLVITCSSILTYFLYYQILVPYQIEYLKSLIFILVIACFVQLLELVLKRYFTGIHKLLGVYLPLITTNCAVFGVVLLNIANGYNLQETIIFSLGSSLGFMAVGMLFSSIREYLETKKVPNCMKGTPIAFVVAAIMTLLFQQFG